MIQVVSQADASRILGVSRPRIHQMLETKKLDFVLVEERRYVTQDSLDDRLRGVQRPNRKSQHLQQVKKCTACKVELTYENSYMREGTFYPRCTKCHTKSTMFDLYRRNAEKRNLTFRITRQEFSDLAENRAFIAAGCITKAITGLTVSIARRGTPEATLCLPAKLATSRRTTCRLRSGWIGSNALRLYQCRS